MGKKDKQTKAIKDVIKLALQSTSEKKIQKRITLLSSPKSNPLNKDKDWFARHVTLWKSFAPDNFVFTEENKRVISILIYYFNGDALFEKIEEGYSLDKGIYLVGDPGVGKTTIMSVFLKYMKFLQNPNPNLFRETSTEEIVNSTKDREDFYNLVTYNIKTDERGEKKHPVSICIHEFGSYRDVKIYGSHSKEIMDTVYMIRYEVFSNYGKLTHATSNVDTLGLENMHEKLMLSRFKEMFNFIVLEGEDYRK